MSPDNTRAMRAVIAQRLAEEDVVLGQLQALGLTLFFTSMPRAVRGATVMVSIVGVTAYAPTLPEAAANALALILLPEAEA